MKKLVTSCAIAFALIASGSLSAQTLKTPAPSPTQTLKQNFALSDITIEYSRPSAKGRVIYGDLVPYGKIWRTGANAATKVTFGEDVMVEGSALKAGTYALYTIPGKESWDILFYKDLTLGGDVANYKAENEVLRVKVKPTTLPLKVETFSINLTDMTSSTANLTLEWESTRVAVGLKADIDEKIMKNIQTAMFEDKRPYYQAANYYYENDKDLKQALEWANKAVDANPKAYWVVLLKSKIQYKMKDYAGAAATAQQVISLAKEDQNDDYVKMGEKMLADAKSGK